MRKMASLLLALVMVVSMLPGTAMSVTAAGNTAPEQNGYYNKVIVHETFDDINTGMTKGKVGSEAGRNYITQEEGGARFRTGDPAAAGNDEVAIAVIPANNGDFELSFTADFTKLETGAAGSAVGFSVDVRATESGLRCRYIFSADAKGNVCVTLEHAKTYFDTGVDVGATDVDVRIVVDEDLNTSVLVNGRYVGRFGVPTAKGSAGYYYLSVYCSATNAGANDVTLYDLKLAQAPDESVGYTLIQHETFDNVGSGMTRGKVGSTESRNYLTQEEGGVRIRTGNPAASGNDEVAIASGLTIPVRGFELNFIADFNDLVVGATAGNTNGFSVDVRLGDVDGKGTRCRYAFNADAAGNVYVTQYDEAARVVMFDTGLDLPATNVNVSIVADDGLNSKVLVNGRNVAQFGATAAPGASAGCLIVYSGATGLTDTSRTNDVVLYDLKLSQTPKMQAYYTYSTPNIDGKLDEKNWAFDAGSKVALLSDEDYLYVGLKTSNPAPKFTINGATVTANPTSGIVTGTDGKWAGECAEINDRIEVKIPLKSVLGLDYAPGQKVEFSYEWGSAGFTGTVVLAERAMVSYQGFEDYVRAGSGEVYFEQPGEGASVLKLKSGTLTSSGASTSRLTQIDTAEADFVKGVDIEFTADFTSLMVPTEPTYSFLPTAKGNWYDAGFSIELRQNPGRRYAFHSDASGNIYVTQRMNAAKSVTRVDTGLNVGATGAVVRLSSADNGLTTVYINGENKGTLPAPDWALPATGGRGYYTIYNSTKHRNTNYSQGNDVTLYNLVLTQAVPEPKLWEHNLAAQSNKDIEVFLNTTGVTSDGVPNEAEWYMAHALAGSGKAPGGVMGFAWGEGNLYVAGETAAESVALTLNGKSVYANLYPTPSATQGELVVSSDSFEWTIPLSALGISENLLNTTVAYKLTATGQGQVSMLQGNMTLSGNQVLMGDAGGSYTDKNFVITGHGHVHWDRTKDGYAVSQVGLNDSKCVGGSFHKENYIAIDYACQPYTLSFDLTINDLPYITQTFGARGLVFQMWHVDNQAPFALRSDGKGNVIMDVRYHYGDESYDTGVNIGERANFKIVVDDKQIPSVYVNDELVHVFSATDRRNNAYKTINGPSFMMAAANTNRGLNDDGTLSAVDVVLHDVLVTQSYYNDPQTVVDAALDLITEELVVAEGQAQDVSALNLPDRVTVEAVSSTVEVTWSAKDKLTGRVAAGVDLSTGEITRMNNANAFELTATVSYKGVTATKTLSLQTLGTAARGTVGLIVDDANPATGSVTDWNGNRYAFFDTTHNSIVVDRGGSSPFNRIVLRDSDEYSRVSARHLGVFISDDGKNFTKVTGWLLHQEGRTYTLYNLNETARYVKVHTYHDDMDITGEKASFYNRVSDMMVVSNEKNLPGAGGKFAYSTVIGAANDTATEQKDTPVFISLASLGAKEGQYKSTCADFRFTIGDTTLAHWYNGKDGFYVRVPNIAAKGSVEITAHWGCKTARDWSDGEAVFEVTYGNVALIDLSKETHVANGQGSKGQGTGIGTHGRPFTFPNGDLIVVSRRIETDADVAVFRSTDGGHTFSNQPVLAFTDGHYKNRGSGFGGFMWDDQIKTTKDGVTYEGRLYLLVYNGKVGDDTDYRMVITYSDDYGYTWSEPEFLNMPGSELVQKSSAGGGGNAKYQELQNADAWIFDGSLGKRNITYCDGLALVDRDGTGPEVDYVMMVNQTVYSNPDNLPVSQLTQPGGATALYNATTAIYSTDGGVTWTCSDTLITCGVDPSRGVEDGCSESGLAQLDDGSLYTVIRGQKEGEYTLYHARSFDGGKTWVEMEYSDIHSSNTSPVLAKYGSDRLLAWSSCTGLSMISYRRTPMHVGLSSNNYESFGRVLDATFATAFDTVKDVEGRMTQPGIAISPDGKDAFICYFDHSYFYNVWEPAMYEYVGTVGFLIEDFDQMMYGTKGAWDNFEVSSLKYQGWLVERDGSIELSREQAVSGKHSMKVLDENAGAATHAVRQIPSMMSGTVGAKMMVPKSNESEFVMELKAAYNFTHMQFTVAAVSVTPSGTVYFWNGSTKTAVATVEAGSWNDIAVTFDVNTGKGTLFVNGNAVAIDYALPHVNNVLGVTAVSFNQNAGTVKKGDCLYVDDFYANELTMVARTIEEVTEPTVLGRFMTIVRKVITVDGQQVELSQWGWVPGI